MFCQSGDNECGVGQGGEVNNKYMRGGGEGVP